MRKCAVLKENAVLGDHHRVARFPHGKLPKFTGQQEVQEVQRIRTRKFDLSEGADVNHADLRADMLHLLLGSGVVFRTLPLSGIEELHVPVDVGVVHRGAPDWSKVRCASCQNPEGRGHERWAHRGRHGLFRRQPCVDGCQPGDGLVTALALTRTHAHAGVALERFHLIVALADRSLGLVASDIHTFADEVVLAATLDVGRQGRDDLFRRPGGCGIGRALGCCFSGSAAFFQQSPKGSVAVNFACGVDVFRQFVHLQNAAFDVPHWGLATHREQVERGLETDGHHEQVAIEGASGVAAVRRADVDSINEPPSSCTVDGVPLVDFDASLAGLVLKASGGVIRPGVHDCHHFCIGSMEHHRGVVAAVVCGDNHSILPRKHSMAGNAAFDRAGTHHSGNVVILKHQ